MSGGRGVAAGRGHMTVDSLALRSDSATFVVRCPAFSVSISLEITDGTFGDRTDFLLPLTLLPAMRNGFDLTLPGAISPRLLASSSRLQDIFSLWNEAYERVAVRSEAPEAPPAAPGRGTAAFFSGGADSFYTVVEHLDEIDMLVFVDRTFDGPWAPARENARAAAAELGKPLCMVTTDLRMLGNAARLEFADYGGPLLAGIALLFQHSFSRVLIASSFSYAALIKWGSHPLTDPLWSTEALELVHDGSEATRPMKMARLAENDVAMRRLRVCHGKERDAGGEVALNCGRCPKCVRTMVNLRAAGVLEACEALPDELDLEAVASIPVVDDRDVAFMVENLRALDGRGGDEDLADALRRSLADSRLDQVGAAEVLELRRRVAAAETVIAKRDSQIRRLQESASWRMTAPLRKLGRPARR